MKNKEALVLINEQHRLLPEQERILFDSYESVEFRLIPPQGWTKEEMQEILKELKEFMMQRGSIVFVSPVPYLLLRLAEEYGEIIGSGHSPAGRVRIFHNDRREKTETPDGRVIYTVPKEGWELI